MNNQLKKIQMLKVVNNLKNLVEDNDELKQNIAKTITPEKLNMFKQLLENLNKKVLEIKKNNERK
jgi:hypothetical protein